MTDIKALVMKAYQNGDRKAVIPAGTYHIPSRRGALEAILFQDLKDFEIDATGVKLILEDINQLGIHFVNCEDVTFKGATIDGSRVAFTQGIIEDIDVSRMSCDLLIDQGYPTDLEDRTYFDQTPIMYVHDPHIRQLKPKTYDYYTEKVEKLDERRFRYHFSNPLNKEVEVSDLFTTRGKCSIAIKVSGGARLRMENITVHTGLFAILEEPGDGDNHYDGIIVTYGPKPAGATSPRLHSTTADAFHSGQMRIGPKLTNCMFEGMPDDGINIKGRYAMAVVQEGNRLILGTPTGAPFFRPGDRIVLRAQDGALKDQTVVKHIRHLVNYAPPGEVEFKRMKAELFAEVTLERPLSNVEFCDLLSSNDVNGKDFVIRNCTVRNNRARGFLLRGENGIVEGCTLDGNSMMGMKIAPEYYWNEADFSSNLTIRNNIFINTGRNNHQPALCITGDEAEAIGHEGITIENNHFVHNYGPNIHIGMARGVTVSNNYFGKTNTFNELSDVSMPTVELKNVDDVLFESNRFAIDQPRVETSGNVNNVRGIDL